MIKLHRLLYLVIALFLFNTSSIHARDVRGIGEKGGGYLAAVGVAHHLKHTSCFYAWFQANQWETLPQAFEEFSKVIITEMVLEYPQASRAQIEQAYNAERGKIEKIVYSETEKFRNITVSDDECRREGEQVRNSLMTAYKDWKLLKNGSAWEFYANQPSFSSQETHTSSQLFQTDVTSVSPTLQRRPTMDETLEGAQRIDFFKKLLDLNVITQDEFNKKRAEILSTM